MAEGNLSVSRIAMTRMQQFLEEQINDSGSSRYHWPILKDSESWIQDCLNSQSVEQYFPQVMIMKHVRPKETIDTPQFEEKNTNISIPAATILPKISSSIFHNFQKHLKTLIKKLVIVKKNPARLRHRAYDLWRIFIVQLSSSKKILYIIFGEEYSQSEISLAEMAEGIPKLEKLLSQSSLQEINEAQTFLRSAVLAKLEPITKVQLKAHCKMVKFDQFCVYLKNFINELRKGGLSRRITKECKMRLLTNPQPPIP